MYVLIHRDRVVVGPMLWNRAMFSAGLERLGINIPLSRTEPSTPLVLDDHTRIAYSRYEYPAFNPKTQFPHGPFWNLNEDVAVGTFEVQDKTIDQIKLELKQVLASERYSKEVSGTTVTINDVQYRISTERFSRDTFIQKYVAMGDSDTVSWKFSEGFVTLTKAQLGSIIQAINTKVQEAFDWELTKLQEIDSATTAQELDAIVIITPPVQPEQSEE